MKKVGIIAGGGTGGHLYPGIAVAREFQAQVPDLEIHFVGSHQGLETKTIPKEGFPLHLLSVGGLVRTGRVAQIKTLLMLPLAFLKAVGLIIKLRPAFVLGIGGYAAGPFVLMSSFFVRNTFIWEPNAHPGFTNRLLSRFVKTAFVVFEKAGTLLKSSRILTVGLPVRKSISYKPRSISDSFRVLVVGGSQGARAINRAVSEAFVKYGDALSSVELVHQTGVLDFPEIQKKYQGRSGVQAFSFLENMGERLQWADLVISRGGVGAVSEVIACRKASIVIPLPTAAENHQQANAEVLVAANAGEMVLQRDLTPELVRDRILHYISHPEEVARIEANLQKMERPGGAATIVAEIRKESGI